MSNQTYALEEFILSEFGRVDLGWFDFTKKYRGSLFRLSPDAAKRICEILGFTANFELPGIRSANIDVLESVASCILEIERNIKPTDLAVRYSRERWTLQEENKKQGDNRPWIRSEYFAKYIPDNLVELLAEQLQIPAGNATKFIIRINFKDKTFGIISPEELSEKMPSGGFSQFSLPNEAMLAILGGNGSGQDNTASDDSKPDKSREQSKPVEMSKHEVAGEPPEDSVLAVASSMPAENKSESEPITQQKTEEKTESRRETVESSSAKYATYSRSEVDQMLKQQSESLASALGSKISAQQRVFQEAVEHQEKSFAKLSDGFVFQFDQTRQRLEGVSKQSEQTIQAELESFKKDLSKELETYRAQINKTVVPVAKFIEEKNTKQPEKAQKEAPAKAGAAQANNANLSELKPLVIACVVSSVVSLVALFVVVMPQLSKINDLQKQVENLTNKLQETRTSNSAQGTPIISASSPSSAAGNLARVQDDDGSHPISTSGSK